MSKIIYFITTFVLFLYLFISYKEVCKNMVDVYITLIVFGRRTIDKVPENIRDAVLTELTIMGIDGYGNPITE